MILIGRRLLAVAAIAMGTALGGCVGDYGYGGVGYASDYYGSGFGYAGAPYGAYGGWYDYYYPGTGVYVFDRSGRRSLWNDRQRGYWQQRAHGGRPGFGRPDVGRPPRWNGGRPDVGAVRPDRPWRGDGAARPWQGRGPGAAQPGPRPDRGARPWGGGGRGRPGGGDRHR